MSNELTKIFNKLIEKDLKKSKLKYCKKCNKHYGLDNHYKYCN